VVSVGIETSGSLGLMVGSTMFAGDVEPPRLDGRVVGILDGCWSSFGGCVDGTDGNVGSEGDTDSGLDVYELGDIVVPGANVEVGLLFGV
jgi:hypothetical protein